MTESPGPFSRVPSFLANLWRHAFWIVFFVGGSVFGNPPPAVSFDGKTLVKAYEKAENGASVIEYLPKGETLETWKRLASYLTFSGMDDPKMLALSMARSVLEKNPNAKHALVEHPRTKDVILDFVTWPPDESFIEFNVFHITRSGREELQLQQYALRAYGKDIQPFLKSLPAERERLVELMAKSGLKKLK